MKTHRGLAKRVKTTGSGKLKRSHAYTSHRFHGKTKNKMMTISKKYSIISAKDGINCRKSFGMEDSFGKTEKKSNHWYGRGACSDCDCF